jgi:single-strand DNA-binding protein
MADGPLVAKIGTVAKEAPVLRFSKGKGTPYVKFSIAVKPYVPKDQPQPETTYYDVTAFKSLAEHIAECVDKGDRIGVIGTGSVREYDKKDGTKGTSKEILADFVGPDLRFCGADIHRSTRESRGLPPRPQYAPGEEEF